jgi:predicted regulator of Ras-like GTPase activity (Roadblock/LC7/MglB family)
MEFDGDEFAENDYGIVVDSSSDVLNLDQKIDSLAQAALQTQQASLSDVMKMWSSANSLAEKIRILEKAENRRMQQARESEQMQAQQAQAALQAQMATKQMELESTAAMNSEDNETKILVAQIGAEAKLATSLPQTEEAPMSQEAKERLKEQIREFDIKIQQDNKKLELEKERNQISRISANKKSSS